MKVKIYSANPFPLECQKGLDGHRSEIIIPLPNNIRVPSGETVIIPLKFSIEIPEGHEGQIRLHSSIGKLGIIIPNGTIDSYYRGEVSIALSNIGVFDREFIAGQRIGRLVIAPVIYPDIEFVKVKERSLF